MMLDLRDNVKRVAAIGAQAMFRQASYRRTILVLSHMRATTTALSNVLCSHADVSGYGETHVPHKHVHSLGQIIVNQARRGAFRPGSRRLLDKILHDNLDVAATEAFYQAQAIFMVRAPKPAVASIVNLARDSGMASFASPAQAAAYYASRVESLAEHWDRFSPSLRWGTTSEALLSRPDTELARIGVWLQLSTRLENQYVSHRASRHGGGGDPKVSGNHTRILAKEEPADLRPVADVPPDLSDRCLAAYSSLTARFDNA
jgi:hypothetical protein